MTQANLFTVIDNDATTLRIDGSEGDLTLVAAEGNVFAGTYGFTTMMVAGKARVSTLDRMVIDREIVIDGSTLVIGYLDADEVSLRNGGLLTHQSTTTLAGYRLEVGATTSVTIDATSRIDVSGRGYLGAYSGGNNSSFGRTTENVLGSNSLAGGSYGGFGGAKGGVPSAIYGDQANPDEPGSGGGSDKSGYVGGNGGGLVRIRTGTLTLAGNILADGGAGITNSYYGYGGSGGSGGGILIEATNVSGSGSIYARGGMTAYRGGGGGGRIAIYSPNLLLPQTNLLVNGGTGSSNGFPGTLYLH